LKVGLVIYGPLEGQSGGYLYDRRLVRHLEDSGDHVEVVSLPPRSSELSVLDNLDPRLLRRLRALDVDVLVEDELGHPSLCLLNGRLKKNVGYPVVGLVHHLACRAETCSGKALRHRATERRFLQGLDGLICNSEATRRSIQELVPHLDGAVAYPGRDHIVACAKERPVRPGALRIIYLGNLLPHKGLDVLVRAMAVLPRGRFRLEVVGSPSDPAYHEMIWDMLVRWGLDEEVRFHGRLPDRERDEVLDACHVLAVPSFHEGYGLVFVEALARGLPVIAPASGGAGEVIAHGREGFLVGPGDHQAVSAHLLELGDDRVRLHEMSQAARRRFDVLPTWGAEMGKARDHLLKMVRGQ
jgi:glycosyltransferase involved in cell wall biosynthesis